MSQSLKLGLPGLETELPPESRINSGYTNELLKITAQAVSGKIHTDFIARRRVFTITWDVVTQDTEQILNAHIDSQISNGTFLSFIQTDKNAVPEAIQVEADVPSYGALLPNGDYYYYGAVIILTETL